MSSSTGGVSTPHKRDQEGGQNVVYLTNRELELLHYVAHRKSDGEIAEIFRLSLDAAMNAVQAVIAKLGFCTRHHAAEWVRLSTQFFLREE